MEQFFLTVFAIIGAFLDWSSSTRLLEFFILITLLRIAWLQGRIRKANQVQTGMAHDTGHYVEEMCYILEQHTKIAADHSDAVDEEILALYKEKL